MQIHEIQPKTRQRKARRIGRGGKKGTYSGRGMKGQRSRAGARFQPRVRELLKRYPKLRGYRRNAVKAVVTLNLEALEKHFEKGAVINPEALAQKKIIGTIKKRSLPVKILGGGEITKPFAIQGCQVSKAAKEKIEKVGGTVT